MTWLNYHHLLYFGSVVRTGSVGQAARELNLTQPAVSAQIRSLERSLKQPLLTRRGRGVVPTETGRVVARYAEEIASLGRALQETLAGREPDRLAPLRIGVVDALPKLLVQRLVEPVLAPRLETKLVMLEGQLERLLADLAIHELDAVLADEPAPASLPVRAFSHPLVESQVGFFAPASRAAKLRRGFPGSLHQAAVLLPPAHTALRRSLDSWFASHGVSPRVVAEIDDSAVINVFGQHGLGIFGAPLAVASEVRRQHGVRLIGVAESVVERVFAITVERRIAHPAVQAIIDRAKGRQHQVGRKNADH